MKKELLIKSVSDAHESYLAKCNKQYADFLNRIVAMYEWWSKEAITVEEKFVGSKVYVKGKEAVCVYANVASTPYFFLEFRFRPYWSGDNIGSGMGEPVTISF